MAPKYISATINLRHNGGRPMAKSSIWCGYLEAGEKSSPVVLDHRLETGNPDTIFLFNMKRKEIIQYNRRITEPKLREFNEDECAVMQELKTAYLRARRQFKVRAERPAPAPVRRGRAASAAAEKRVTEPDEALYALSGGDDEFADSLDDDWDTDDED